MRMRHVVIIGLSGSTVFFPPYLIKSRFSKKRYWTSYTCFDFLNGSVWKTSHCKKNWERCGQNVYWAHLNYPLFLSDFNETWLFPTDFRKIFKCHFFHGTRALRFMIGTACFCIKETRRSYSNRSISKKCGILCALSARSVTEKLDSTYFVHSALIFQYTLLCG
jgi:hypothetical protein